MDSPNLRIPDEPHLEVAHNIAFTTLISCLDDAYAAGSLPMVHKVLQSADEIFKKSFNFATRNSFTEMDRDAFVSVALNAGLPPVLEELQKEQVEQRRVLDAISSLGKRSS